MSDDHLLQSHPDQTMSVDPGPAICPPGQAQEDRRSVRERYSDAAYARIGLDQQGFRDMDPVARNRLITMQYARMYQSDPETYRWAGMAAYASDKAGVGMQQTNMLEAGGALPGGATASELAGAPQPSTVMDTLAAGNAGIYEDMMWQHLAFQEGGLEALEEAERNGDIPEGQMDGWRQLAAGREALATARASGDQAAIDAAQRQVWAGNRQLLHHEQGFVQDIAYDRSTESRDAFRFLSSDLNIMGVESPIPGNGSFGDYREAEGRTGTADIGDFGQRWDWIDNSMLPAFQRHATDPGSSMNRDMARFASGGGNPQSGVYDAMHDYAQSPVQRAVGDVVLQNVLPGGNIIIPALRGLDAITNAIR